MDLEMPSWGKRKPEEAPQGQGRRALRQAVAEGGSEREVLRRLVDVLATLSLVNAAELRDLTATVFKTYFGPKLGKRGRRNGRGRSALSRLRWRNQEQARSGASRLSRADSQEQLGPPFVHGWVAFLRSLAATKELGTEHVAVLRQYWESNVLKSAPVQLAAHVRAAERRAGKSRARNGGPSSRSAWTRPLSPSRERWRQHCGCRKG